MKTRRYFSLIELLIVIGIMGALAALILPAFSDSETAAKDTACDYNQAGTLRYLKMFYGANGVYPTGFHTGGSDSVWTPAHPDNEKDVQLTACGTHNFQVGSTPFPLTSEMPETDSLVGAGIVTLAYGQGENAGVAKLQGADAAGVTVVVVNADKECITTNKVTKSWTEDLDPVTGDVVEDGAPLKYRGVPLGYIAWLGTQEDAAVTAAYKAFKAEGEPKFDIVPLYVAPTIDWEHYYSDGPNDSKISIAMPGKCPWGSDGQARYYIAFFKVYKDGSPAKLLCTSCPDCGILEANAF